MKKKFSIGGMATGLLIVLFGILAMCGIFGNGDYSGNSSPYDSGYASFGGDYYTYSVNNSAETASAARATAKNLNEISDLLRYGLGTFMIGTGLAVFCGFGVVFSGLKQEIGDVSEVSETKILEIPENVFEETQTTENVQPIFENEENV